MSRKADTTAASVHSVHEWDTTPATDEPHRLIGDDPALRMLTQHEIASLRQSAVEITSVTRALLRKGVQKKAKRGGEASQE